MSEQYQLDSRPFVVGEIARVVRGTYEGFDVQIDRIDGDGETVRVILVVFGGPPPFEVKTSDLAHIES